MKSILLSAQMRELLMRAFLQIQVDEENPLTLEYAAKMSAMPDAELLERLTEYSRDGHGPYAIAQQALLQWRANKHKPPVAPDQRALLDVHLVLSITYELGGHDNHEVLASGLEDDIRKLIDNGDLLTNSNASMVAKYNLSSF